jgi:hypothetical protein
MMVVKIQILDCVTSLQAISKSIRLTRLPPSFFSPPPMLPLPLSR